MYIDRLDVIVKKGNNTYHRTIKIKPVDVTLSTCFDLNDQDSKEGRKFKVGDHVIISKYNNNFAKVYTPNLPEEFF